MTDESTGSVPAGDSTLSMTPEEFRAAGHRLIDWLADYRAGIERLPVKAQVRPGEVADRMPAPPAGAGTIDELVSQLEQVVIPGMTNLQHPANFAYFPANHSLAAILGDLASTGLGGLGISWESNPALTEVEQVVCEWVRELCGLSPEWRGCINDTASTSALTSLICAREKATNYALIGRGVQGHEPPLVVYTTDQAHSSVRKAALLAGFGAEMVRSVETDPQSRMRPDAFRTAVLDDLDAGRQPCAVVLGVGTTGVTAFDPIRPLAEIAREFAIWVHADAAMAGSALLLPEMRHLFDGIELVDVIVWNPHKWMGTALDCSLYYVRDVEHLVRVMSTNPSYLQSVADGQVVQYRDWGLPLGRRFRALKLWFQLHLEGIEAIRARLRRDLDNARWLENEILSAWDRDWHVVSPVTLQTVCVRHEPEGLTVDELDTHTLRWVRSINDGGAAYLTPAVHDGRWMVRVSIGALTTERRHVESLWGLMQKAAREATLALGG